MQVRYEDIRLLQKGGQSQVRQVRHIESGKEYAMKIYDKTSKNKEAIEMDKLIMTQFNHGQLIKCHNFIENDEVSVLVTDLYASDFRDLQNACESPIEEEVVKEIF